MGKLISSFLGKRNIPHSLKTKLILSVLLLLVLFILIFLINNIVLNAILIKRTNQSVANSVKQADMSLTYVLEQAKEQAYQLSAQVTEREDIKSLLSGSGEQELSEYQEYNSTRQYISELTKIGLTNKIESIYVYSSHRNKLVTSNSGVFLYQDVSEHKWIQEALSFTENNALKWIGYCRYMNEQQWEPHAYMLSLICKAHTINRDIKSEVYFGLNFDENMIYKIFRDISITPHSVVYLIDQNGVILSAGDKKMIGTNLKDHYKTDILTGYDSESTTIATNKEQYHLISARNSVTNWDIVVLIPEWEFFEERRMFWIIISLCLCLASTGIIFIAYRTIVRYVDLPVMKLVRFMKKAEKGNFTIRIKEYRKDEFGALYTGFNEMVEKIEVLIRELYQEKLLKRDVELKYLQKMINPHFLYNTLDNINWLARENRLADVLSLSLALSNQYRTIFNRGKEYVTLAICIQNMENYLFIHKMRYNERFSYRIDPCEELKDTLVLNLILQPTVENALIHGIHNRGDTRGMVIINIKRLNNLVRIRVYDNGIGMRKEKREIIRKNMNSIGKSENSGIKIVNRRIKLFYGDHYGLFIRSSFNKGTCVSFVFPIYEFLEPHKQKKLPATDDNPDNKRNSV